MAKRGLKIVGIVLSVLIVAMLIVTFLISDYIELTIKNYLEVYGGATILISIFLIEILPQYAPPHAVTAAALLLGFPFYETFLLSIIGIVFADLIGFEIGKRYGTRFVDYYFNKKSKGKFGKAMNLHGRWFLFVAAISPVPYLPVVFGSLHIQRFNFLIFGVIPRVLGVVIITLFFI